VLATKNACHAWRLTRMREAEVGTTSKGGVTLKVITPATLVSTLVIRRVWPTPGPKSTWTQKSETPRKSSDGCAGSG